MPAFAGVATLAVATSGLLSYRVTADRIPRALAQPGLMGRGAGPPESAGLGASGQDVLLDRLRRANLQAAAIAVATGAGVAVGVSRPLQRLAAVTQRYGGGERTARAWLSGGHELAELGRVFDGTADRLQVEQDLKQRFTTDVAPSCARR